jgi:hypothetical protein
MIELTSSIHIAAESLCLMPAGMVTFRFFAVFVIFFVSFRIFIATLLSPELCK